MELVVVAVIGITIFIIIHGLGSHKRAEQRWRICASALGSSFNPGPHSHRYIHARRYLPEMYGQYDGQDIYVGVRTYTTGSGKNRQTHYYTYIDVVFDVALKRGLRARRADGVSKFFGDVFGQRDIQVGHEAFDRDFRIDGHDPAQIAGLLRDNEVIGHLQGNYGPFRIEVDDYRVRIEASGTHTEASVLGPLLGPAVGLYRAVLRTWSALPPSVEEARVGETWQRVSERLGLTYRARGMVAQGHTDQVGVRAEVTILEKSWATVVSATFDPPLGVGLELSREGLLSSFGKMLGGQDIELGDPAFDRHFIVKGRDPDRVKLILEPDARAILLALDQSGGNLEVSDRAVTMTVPLIVSDQDPLLQLISQVTEAGNKMVAYRRPTGVGPYR